MKYQVRTRQLESQYAPSRIRLAPALNDGFARVLGHALAPWERAVVHDGARGMLLPSQVAEFLEVDVDVVASLLGDE